MKKSHGHLCNEEDCPPEIDAFLGSFPDRYEDRKTFESSDPDFGDGPFVAGRVQLIWCGIIL